MFVNGFMKRWFNRGGGANFECCVYKQQLTNPTCYAFNINMKQKSQVLLAPP